jgi:predicted PolB exonuclease-like 3'-5' exonuclease
MLILDIETAAQPGLTYPEADRTPPATHKAPAAVAKWREADRAAWAKDCALNPRTGRVVAVGLAGVNGAQVVTLEHLDERQVISHALSAIDATRPLVTFNGTSFDVPYLFTRAAIVGALIPVRVGEYLRRYSTHPHIDLAAVLANYGPPRKGDTLHGWARAFGLPVEDETTGADMASMVEAGDWAGVADHCRSDILLTRALYERMADAGRI